MRPAIVVPGEVAGGPKEPRGDITGKAGGFSMQGGDIFAQFAVVVVHGEKGVGQGSGSGGRNTEVEKGFCCRGDGEEGD
jgi:hypothetical protein